MQQEEEEIEEPDSITAKFKAINSVPRELIGSQISEDDNALDGSSLVPASITDDSSFVNVIPSAPNSLNTFTTTTSFEDLVLIDRGEEENK